MQTLILMRHAKSSWDDPQLDDHDRPLNARGRRDAELVARALHAKGFAPSLIWASTAERTMETALILMRTLPGPQAVRRIPEFYHASPPQALGAGYELGEPDVESCLWLGHNPGWSALAELFTDRPHSLPTAGVVVLSRIKGSEDWLSPISWRAVDAFKPRDLR